MIVGKSIMVHCQACGITAAARIYGVTFHRFPKNKNQRSAWINFVNKNKGLYENFKCTTLCSLHFDKSCFDKTSMKVCLKPLSIPTIHVSRSKYERIFTTVTAMTVHSQTETINETFVKDTMAIDDISIIDASTMDFDMDISNMKESTVNDNLQIEQSQLTKQMNVDIQSQPNGNVNIESLPSTSFGMLSRETDISFEILPSDTPKEVILKKKIVSLGRSLAEKSNTIRKLQKKNWNQQKQIMKLKSIIHELGEKFSFNSTLFPD